jgi:hypothetical protein
VAVFFYLRLKEDTGILARLCSELMNRAVFVLPFFCFTLLSSVFSCRRAAGQVLSELKITDKGPVDVLKFSSVPLQGDTEKIKK